MKIGDLVQCKRTKGRGMIVSINISSDYKYPEILWFSNDEFRDESKKITSRGFETLEKIDGD